MFAISLFDSLLSLIGVLYLFCFGFRLTQLLRSNRKLLEKVESWLSWRGYSVSMPPRLMFKYLYLPEALSSPSALYMERTQFFTPLDDATIDSLAACAAQHFFEMEKLEKEDV